MNRKREVSLWGALVICAVAIVMHKLLKVSPEEEQKIAGKL